MDMDNMCAVPVVVGHYWTVGSLPGLVALDISNPDKPVEVSRLKLGANFTRPHWRAADRKNDRLVITGNESSWVLVARIDPKNGALSLDESFREPGAQSPGVSFDRASWPHGAFGKAIVHGALFGPEWRFLVTEDTEDRTIEDFRLSIDEQTSANRQSTIGNVVAVVPICALCG